MIGLILAAVTSVAFHCSMPDLGKDSTADSVMIHSRVMNLPPPYRFFVEDSAKGLPGDKYSRTYQQWMLNRLSIVVVWASCVPGDSGFARSYNVGPDTALVLTPRNW